MLENILIISGLIVSQTISAQSWLQVGQDIDGEAAGDYSGRSVSLSSDGSTVAIGAYGNEGNNYFHEPLFINVHSNLVGFRGNVTSSNFRKRKKQKEIEERQKEMEERKKKRLRNGNYKKYYSNGALLRIVNYKKDKGKNGVEQYYYKNGKLKSESNYKDYKSDGVKNKTL